MSMQRNGLPIRILDVLETDGGWLTTEGIAHQLGWNNTESVYRALRRLLPRGLVEERVVQLAGILNPQPTTYSGSGVGITEHRAEWRIS